MSNQKGTKSLNPLLMQYQAVTDFEANKSDRIKEFKSRIEKFSGVASLKEAKDLALKIMPTSNEINRFYIDNAKCVIVNKDDMFRISLDTPDEFISYDFR